MEEINQGGQFGQQLLEHLRSLLVRSKELRRKAMLLHSSPTRMCGVGGGGGGYWWVLVGTGG